jgi:tetratricopeptide (TPR) repeat protein
MQHLKKNIANMTIIELYNKIYSTEETKTPDSFIPLFEENIDFIESQDIQTDNDSYNAVMRIIADYAHNLKIKEAYTKALPYLDRAIDLFENYKGFDKTKMNDVEFYRILRFDRGVSNYYKKDYSKSELDFLWLAKKNPDNDIYKAWISALRYRKYDLTIKILWYVIAVSVIFGAIVDRKTHSLIYDLILYSGVFALIAALIFETIKYINKRKINAA